MTSSDDHRCHFSTHDESYVQPPDEAKIKKAETRAGEPKSSQRRDARDPDQASDAAAITAAPTDIRDGGDED